MPFLAQKAKLHHAEQTTGHHAYCRNTANAQPGNDDLTGLTSVTTEPGQVNDIPPLPSHKEFQVSHLHRLPPCMMGISFQIIAYLLEVFLTTESEWRTEIKPGCGGYKHQPLTSAGQVKLQQLTAQVTACQGKTGGEEPLQPRE